MGIQPDWEEFYKNSAQPEIIPHNMLKMVIADNSCIACCSYTCVNCDNYQDQIIILAEINHPYILTPGQTIMSQYNSSIEIFLYKDKIKWLTAIVNEM